MANDLACGWMQIISIVYLVLIIEQRFHWEIIQISWINIHTIVKDLEVTMVLLEMETI